MKKVVVLIIFIVLTVIIVFAYPQIIEKKEVQSNQNNVNEFNCGIQVYNEDMEMLEDALDTFSDKKDRTVRFINLMDHETEFTLIITLNGSLCEFINGEVTSRFFSHKVDSNSYIDIPIKINLDREYLNKEDNKLVFTIIAENQVISSLSDKMLFYSVSFAHDIIYDTTVESEQAYDLSSSFSKKLDLVERLGDTKFVVLQSIDEENLSMKNTKNITFNDDNKGKVRVEFNGDSGKYALILFCDNKPVMLQDNKMNYNFQLEENEIFSKEFDVSSSILSSGQIYAVVFPVSNKNYFAITSEKSMYNSSEKNK